MQSTKFFLLSLFFIFATFQSFAAETDSATNQRYFVHFFNPTYVLPYYYTSSPYNQVYVNNTPDNQKIMSSEFKGQLSIYVPLVQQLFDPNTSLRAAYTQLSYWQVYASSQFFRETNYEPEVFVEHHWGNNWIFRGGVDHESNGRGGETERSWNRAKIGAFYKTNDFMIGLTAWNLIFKNQSSDLHNPDIAHYLGYENLLISKKAFYNTTVSLQLQNLESGLSRGFVEASVSYPLSRYISFYVQYFNGYGQSLIEYNHRTQGIGVGFDLSNWLG